MPAYSYTAWTHFSFHNRARLSSLALLELMVSDIHFSYNVFKVFQSVGPAKVFTQRGAYRQCFLRITREQEDRFNSMNLALASDRTIPISVESVGRILAQFLCNLLYSSVGSSSIKVWC